MKIKVLTSTTDLNKQIPAWDDLSRNASEANVFYDSWMLLPALELLREEDVFLVFIWTEHKNSKAAQLAAIFPLVSHFGYHGIPIRWLSMWRHKHCFLGTPLLRKGYEEAAFNALLGWIDHMKPKPQMLEFGQISADGPIFKELQGYSHNKGRTLIESISIERPIIRPLSPFEDYIKQRLSHKHFNNFIRKQKKLAETGEIAFENLSRRDQLDSWISDFLYLEKSGWKSDAGGAMALDPAQTRFYEKITQAAFEHGALQMSRLTVNNTPLAMRTQYLSGDVSFATKIAYDERYARYSPGVLLELRHMKDFLSSASNQVEQQNSFVDSCADPRHPVLSVLWAERRAIKSVNLCTSAFLSKPIVNGISILRNGYRQLHKRQSYAAIPLLQLGD